MANAPDTTNLCDERNTPREIVSDMEDTIISLAAYLEVMEVLTEPYEKAAASDREHSILWTLADVVRSKDTLREQRNRLQDAIDRGGSPSKPEPVLPASRAKLDGRTVYQLCHEWDVVRAKLDLDLLQSRGDDKENDRIIDEARAQFRAIERAILATDPDTMRNVDLVVMLRHARKVIGDDQFLPEQEERCHGMLDLIDAALTRRTGPKDWNREVQS